MRTCLLLMLLVLGVATRSIETEDNSSEMNISTDNNEEETKKDSDSLKMNELAKKSALAKRRDHLRRLGRFIFDTTSASSYSGGSDLFNLNIDTARVYEGLFKPENVAIHVGQNAVDFLGSTIGWFLAGALYRNSNFGRSLFGLDHDHDAGYETTAYSDSGYGTSFVSDGARYSEAKTQQSFTPIDFIADMLGANRKGKIDNHVDNLSHDQDDDDALYQLFAAHHSRPRGRTVSTKQTEFAGSPKDDLSTEETVRSASTAAAAAVRPRIRKRRRKVAANKKKSEE